MLGQRSVFPSMEIAARELKAADEAFTAGIAEAGKQDLETMSLLETVSEQSRMIGEKDTGKDFGAKLAQAYCALL